MTRGAPMKKGLVDLVREERLLDEEALQAHRL